MKVRMIVLTLTLCLLGLSAAFAAENPNMGTWKLNEAKSKIPAGAGKNTTVVYSPRVTKRRSPPMASTRLASPRIRNGPVSSTASPIPLLA